MAIVSPVPVAPTDAFAALACPTRRGLFEHLVRGGEQNVRALTARAGVSQPAVSKHLAVLTRAGLVCARPEGRQTFYSARPSGLKPVADWLEGYAAFWDERLDRLEGLLNRREP
ncbi:MAG: ArsR/SmtB family transcription factor [Planctomycetota bacterium]